MFVLLSGNMNKSLDDVIASRDITFTPSTGPARKLNLAYLKNISWGSSKGKMTFLLGESVEAISKIGDVNNYWQFRLVKLSVCNGDSFSVVLPEDGSISRGLLVSAVNFLSDVDQSERSNKRPSQQICNLIRFGIGGTEWVLIDDLGKSKPKDSHHIGHALPSGVLICKYHDNMGHDEVYSQVQCICFALSLALGRDVSVVASAILSEELNPTNARTYAVPVMAFSQKSSPLADNWDYQNLKRFVEQACKAFVVDRDWWLVTCDLILQARTSKYLEVKLSLLNTLLDRISKRVNSGKKQIEIDPLLDGRLIDDDFLKSLHSVLSSLSNKWSEDRTKSICGVIKGWNNSPSFPKQVARACEVLGIQLLDGANLAFRHKLIHEGELDKKLTTWDQKAEYLFAIEGIVLLLIVRMINFDGQIYLQSKPHDSHPVSEFLVGVELPELGQANGQS